MNVRFRGRLPWPVAFSFGRAIQQPALDLWKGLDANVKDAQRALLHRAACNAAARRGAYDGALERDRSARAPVAGSQTLTPSPERIRT